ncbi:type II secretion system GspH family protein [Patescibacteria group bacterium]|nr:type II secretion system GspH family protein [Patescibacteria group bacterium]
MLKPFYKKGVRGFTLIELLVVIAIIGVLASIVLASLNTARRKSRDARRLADIKQTQLALELYFDANSSSYPFTLSLLAPNQIPVVPKDPSSSNNYAYDPGTGWSVATPPVETVPASCSPACTTYHLGATLAEPTNPALTNDLDGNSNFLGNNAVGEGPASSCVGTAVAGETCYDVRP